MKKYFFSSIILGAILFVANASYAQQQLVKDDGSIVSYGAPVAGLQLTAPDVLASANYNVVNTVKSLLADKNIVLPKGTYHLRLVIEPVGQVSTIHFLDPNDLLTNALKSEIVQALYLMPNWSAATKANEKVASLVEVKNIKF